MAPSDRYDFLPATELTPEDYQGLVDEGILSPDPLPIDWFDTGHLAFYLGVLIIAILVIASWGQ